MQALGLRARAAARQVALARPSSATPRCSRWPRRCAPARRQHPRSQRLDLADAKAGGQNAAFIDRLLLDETRLDGVAEAVAALPPCPIRSGACWRPGRSPTACASSASRRRSASSP
jgi:glutamate-5-semialdehyde dehydrogenase